jgi:dienelactone hydrolase
MVRRGFAGLLSVVLLIMLYSAVTAQEQPLVEPVDQPTAAEETSPTPTPQPLQPQEVEIEGSDGHKLRGAYYAAASSDGPAVLLLHQLYTTRSSWAELIQPLMDAGYRVLAVDLRGYGATRGAINWALAQEDTALWFAWLASQPGVTSVALVGSSMGSTLALNGCAVIERCKGAVALSPGLSYFQISTHDAVQGAFPKLIVYAEQDRYPARDAPEMVELGGESVQILSYQGRAHGVDLLKQEADAIPQIISWLKDYR